MLKLLLFFVIANGIDIFINFLIPKLTFYGNLIIHLSWNLFFIYLLLKDKMLLTIIQRFNYSWKLFFSGIVIGVVLYVLVVVLRNLNQNHILILDWRFYILKRYNLNAAFMGIIFAITEEFAYRSWIINGSQSYFGLLLLTSLAFGFDHIPIKEDEVLSKTILGFLLGTSYIITDNLLFSIIIHATYNILASSYFEKEVS